MKFLPVWETKTTCIARRSLRNTTQGKEIYLYLEDLTKSIGPTHIARFIKSAVDSVNLDEVISKYKGGGTSAYASREC